MKLKSVAVFCGASKGNTQNYTDAAKAMGQTIAEQGLTLVYGGGDVGLMGTVANAALDAGGEVIGVITTALEKLEVAHTGLTKLEVVGTMSERKERMAELSDGFISMPGGYGTLDELFEMITWTQLSIHGKPNALLNIDNYFEHLLAFIDTATESGFIQAHFRDMIVQDADPNRVLEKLASFEDPAKKLY